MRGTSEWFCCQRHRNAVSRARLSKAAGFGALAFRNVVGEVVMMVYGIGGELMGVLQVSRL